MAQKPNLYINTMSAISTDVKLFFSKHKWIPGLLKYIGSFVTGAASAAAVLYPLLNARVENLINARISPYEQVLEVITLSNSGADNDTMDTLTDLLHSKSLLEMRPSSRNLVYDKFLTAVANCPKPLGYSLETEMVAKMVNDKLKENGSRTLQLGWFYLRTGNLEKAQKLLERSLVLFDLEKDPHGGGDALHGQFYVLLSRGEKDKALNLMNDMEKRNPRNYSLNLMISELSERSDSDFLSPLSLAYKQRFDDAANSLLSDLRGHLANMSSSTTFPPAGSSEVSPTISSASSHP